MEKVHKVEVMSGGPTFEDPFASPAERIEVLPHTVLFDVVNEEIVPVGEPQLSLHNAVRQVVR